MSPSFFENSVGFWIESFGSANPERKTLSQRTSWSICRREYRIESWFVTVSDYGYTDKDQIVKLELLTGLNYRCAGLNHNSLIDIQMRIH